MWQEVRKIRFIWRWHWPRQHPQCPEQARVGRAFSTDISSVNGDHLTIFSNPSLAQSQEWKGKYGCFAVLANSWLSRRHRHLSFGWVSLLLHVSCRYVHFHTLFPGLPYSQPCVASMFCKSCNCNSSIATRVGFAVCWSLPWLLLLLILCCVATGDICVELHACMAHEDAIHGRQHC